MIFEFVRRGWRSLFLPGTLFVLSALSLHGQLTWDARAGWQVEEGAVSEEALRRLGPLIARMNRARQWHESGHEGEALRLYRQIYREHAQTILAPEAIFQSARLRMERKQWSRAFEHLQSIVETYPDYPRFHRVIDEQFAIARELDEGARTRLFWVIPGFKNRARAVEYYEQIVENAPYSEEAPLALLHAAAVELDRKRHEEAIDFFDRFIADYPRHDLAPEAYLGLANAFTSRVRGPEYDQGATREAIAYFEDFTILHANHPRVDEAEEGIEEMVDLLVRSRLVIGDFYLYQRSNYHAARVFYNEAITIAPDAPSAEEAREKLAEVDRREAR